MAEIDTSDQTVSLGPKGQPTGTTNDTIEGTAGDDTITSGPDDPVIVEWTTTTGGANPKSVEHSQLVQDNDTIIESSGVNTLTGGYGNDTFKFLIDFDFSTVTTTESFDEILLTPTQLSGSNTNGVWQSYLSALAEWRALMESEHGVDENLTTEFVNYLYSSGKIAKTGTASYDDTFTWSIEQLTTNTSDNTITDFGNGHDVIALDGVTLEQFLAHATFSEDGTAVTIGTFTIADVLPVFRPVIS